MSVRRSSVLAVLVVACLGLVPGGSATAQSSCPSVRDYSSYLKRTFKYTHRGGDYRAGRAHPRMMRKLRDMRSCQRGAGHVRIYWTMRRAYGKRASMWRFHRHIDRITPYGEWAIPPYIVARESGGNYRVWNRGGSGASGAYQIMRGTWAANGGRRFASDAAYAPSWAQHIVAHRLYCRRGTQPWAQTR